MNFKQIVIGTVLLFSATVVLGQNAEKILTETGVTGGLVVHLGCGDSPEQPGELTASLAVSDSYRIHGLDSDKEKISRAREYIKSKGKYGQVTVEFWDKNLLPYNDNLVNLIVAEDAGKITEKEMLRVLVPNGVAYLKKTGKWSKVVKPRPEAMDDWTHYLHNPGNNAVAQDTLVGPPRRLQWSGAPKWTRSHEKSSSVPAMVSANGNLFYLIDEGSETSIQRPSDWKLIARDAFNGIVLWKRDIPKWDTWLWPLKSGPAQIPRRLVAVADKVYVTLGIDAPVSVLDADTGKTLHTLDGSEKTTEILVSDDTVFVSLDENLQAKTFKPKDPFVWNEAARAAKEGAWEANEKQHVAAFNAATGKMIWKKPYSALPLTLTVDAKDVYFIAGNSGMACLDRKTGTEKWRSKAGRAARFMYSSKGAILVAYNGLLLTTGFRKVIAHSSATGEKLWENKLASAGHYSPGDLLVIDDLIWSAGSGSKPFIGRGLKSGEIKVQFKPDKVGWFHPRCYRSKATSKYLLASRTGIELADVKAQTISLNHWIRGGCLYGIMPANGLIYCPPHPCACFAEAKTTDLSAANYKWTNPDPPVLIKAMVLTKDKLFVAGPRNMVNEEQVFDHPDDPELQKKLVEQEEAWRGEKGALLIVYSTADGKKLAEYKLASPPVFDGMSAAKAKIFISQMNGDVICFAEKR